MSENSGAANRQASRRAVFGGVVGLGVGGAVLAGCGSEEGSEGGESGGSGTETTSGTVGATSEVPVGGGTIFAAEKVVVTQPAEGEFLAFSAICTHQQCVVREIVGTDIVCKCHESRFSINDGSVVKGPAAAPLEKLQVSVEGEDLVVS